MTIKSVDKAISILNCFRVDSPVQTVGEISSATGFNKSTVSRLLATMEHRGCVEKADRYGSYRLGHRIYLWGAISRIQNNLATIARPVMEELRDRCGEEVSLYVLENDRRLCLERVESHHQIAKISPVGAYFPLHAGASGKVLLAYLPAEERTRLLSARPLEKITAHTHTDPQTLERDLAAIRQKGYAVSRGERESSAYSVTAPVHDARNQVVASLSISGPDFRLTDEQLETNIQGVMAAAREISTKLGGTVCP